MTHPVDDTTRYRAVNLPAVLSLICGIFSVLAALHWGLGVIPLAGILLGWRGLRQIRKAPDDYIGRPVALAGLWLSAVFWSLGYGWLALAYFQEVPDGYQRINYEMLQPDSGSPGAAIPSAAVGLQGKKVYVKAYMAPTRQQVGLKEFIACPAIANCAFCTPDPKPTEMIRVRMQGDLTARYTTHAIGIGGVFRIDPEMTGGVPYVLEADYLR